jgi:acyl-CoA synthetase (AMP-forming)/AMP-acid ligase II
MKAAEIRSMLRPKLSSYMLPGAVKIMDSLPLNPNGKIDRQKLKELI